MILYFDFKCNKVCIRHLCIFALFFYCLHFKKNYIFLIMFLFILMIQLIMLFHLSWKVHVALSGPKKAKRAWNIETTFRPKPQKILPALSLIVLITPAFNVFLYIFFLCLLKLSDNLLFLPYCCFYVFDNLYCEFLLER